VIESNPQKGYKHASRVSACLGVVLTVLLTFVLALTMLLVGGRSAHKQAQAAGVVIDTASGFTVNGFMPNTGAASGGNTLAMTGTSFPYAATSDYYQPGLQALYDGIDNVGLGDLKHSQGTTSWKNLVSGTRFSNAALTNPLWSKNAFYASGRSETDPRRYGTVTVGQQATKPFTFEWVGYTSIDWTSPQFMLASGWEQNGTLDWWLGIDGIGADATVSLDYRDNTTKHDWITTDIAGISGVQANSIMQVAVTYNNSRLHVQLNVNGVIKTADSTMDLTSGQLASIEFLSMPGEQQTVGGMYSFRYYDGVLNSTQLAANFAVDQKRFLDPPVVTFGDASHKVTSGASAGTVAKDMTVQSLTRLTCTVPAYTYASLSGSETAVVPVYVSYNGNTAQVGTYTYTARPDPSVGIALNGAANPSLSGWPSGASLDTEANLLTISQAGTYTISTDDAWGEDRTDTAADGHVAYSDHAIRIGPNIQVILKVAVSATGRPLRLSPVSYVGSGLEIGSGSTCIIDTTSLGSTGASSNTPTYLYCSGNSATSLAGISGAGTLQVSGRSVVYAYGSGDAAGIDCTATRINGGSLWAENASGQLAVSPAPTAVAAGQPLRPVYLSATTYGSVGTLTVPTSGANGKLSTDYIAALSDMSAVNPGLAGVSAVVWLPAG
jgi:hypothetical protein